MAFLSPKATERPQAIPGPSVLEATSCGPVTSPIAHKPSAVRRSIHFIHDTLMAVSIGLLYGVPTVIAFGVFLALGLGLPLGIVAANGAIVMLIGNRILRVAHPAHYTNNASAAAIGATGGIIASIIGSIVIQCKDENGKTPLFMVLCGIVLASALTGTIGSAILIHNHVDLGPIDVLHATRAGALGGAIFGPAVALGVPLVFALLFIVFSRVWLAMMAGLKWVTTHSRGTWDGRTDILYSCGTCGKDPEINGDIEAIERGKQKEQPLASGNE